MYIPCVFRASLFGLIIFWGTGVVSPAVGQPRPPEQPDTVVITLLAKDGHEEVLARTLARHWETARGMKLVREDLPHMTLGSVDGDNKTSFLEILTWRDGSIPDAAPAPILAIWTELNSLVETRAGRPGLDINNVTMIDPVAR